uniref:uncharacterized protein LOC120337881 n=1 Tax=Styela clava TaxID=7725 RepID=UPI00193A0DB7|nr:uncharacterized protein LOC120337881 [Styela clava]
MEKQYENSTRLIYNMVNSSFESPEEQRHVVIYWIIHIILVSGVATITAYILLVLILKEIKGGQSSGNTHGTGSLAKLSRIAKIIVTLMTFIESAISLGQEMTTKFYDTPDHCYIIEASKGIVANFVSFGIYFSFWLRQRVLYSNPVLTNLTNAFTRVASKTSIFLIALFHIGIAVSFAMTHKTYKFVNYKCTVMEQTSSTGIPWIAIFVVVLLLQTSLLLLFSYPLYKHRIEVKFMNNANTINILPVLQRALFATLGFVFFSGTLFIVSGMIADGLLAAILRAIGSFTDFTFMIISFPDWRNTVMPCWRCQTRAVKTVSSIRNTTQSVV